MEESLDIGAYVKVLDADHCCSAEAPDESAGLVLYAPRVELSAASPSCFWNTGDPDARVNPDARGGWATEVAVAIAKDDYAFASGRFVPAAVVSGRRDPTVSAVGPFMAKALRISVARFIGYPGLRFEIYGCERTAFDPASGWNRTDNSRCIGDGNVAAFAAESETACREASIAYEVARDAARLVFGALDVL